jgi:hypothetical protein
MKRFFACTECWAFIFCMGLALVVTLSCCVCVVVECATEVRQAKRQLAMHDRVCRAAIARLTAERDALLKAKTPVNSVIREKVIYVNAGLPPMPPKGQGWQGGKP